MVLLEVSGSSIYRGGLAVPHPCKSAFGAVLGSGGL